MARDEDRLVEISKEGKALGAGLVAYERLEDVGRVENKTNGGEEKERDAGGDHRPAEPCFSANCAAIEIIAADDEHAEEHA